MDVIDPIGGIGASTRMGCTCSVGADGDAQKQNALARGRFGSECGFYCSGGTANRDANYYNAKAKPNY